MNLDSPERLRKNITLMFVDKSTQTNKILNTYLQAMGFRRDRFQMITTTDGANAINFLENFIGKEEAIAKGIPSLIILDWAVDLPGVQIVNKIRSLDARDRRIGTIPMLMITAERPREQIVTAIQAGANAFLVKPITGEMLERKLADISRIHLEGAQALATELEANKQKMDLLEGEEEKTAMEILEKINSAIGLDPRNRDAKNFRIIFTKTYQSLLHRVSQANVAAGDRFSDEGKYKMASGKYADAVKIDNRDTDTHLKLGKMYMKTTQYGFAVDCLNTSLENFPDNLETLALLGEALLKHAKETGEAEIYDEAIKILARAAAKQEEFSERAASLRDLGNAYSAKGETEKAVESYKESLGLVGDQIGTLMNFAMALKAIGQEEDANQVLTMASELTPTDPEELVELGKVWLEREDHKKALHYFGKALNHASTSKEDIQLYETVIKSLLEYGLTREAAPLVDAVSKDRPDLYNSLGMAYVKSHDRDGTKEEPRSRDFALAVKAYTKALELDATGDRYAYLHNRGMAHYKAGNIAEAKKDFQDAYALHPNTATGNMLNAIGVDPATIARVE